MNEPLDQHYFNTINLFDSFVDIVIPGTNTATQSTGGGRNKIPAGETVLVIKTPKGMYIRTNQVRYLSYKGCHGDGMKI